MKTISQIIKPMAHAVIMGAAALMLISNPCHAQSKKGSDKDTYNLQRAYEVLQQDNDEEKALELLGEQLNETPDNIEAILLRSRIFRNRGDYASAISDLNRAIKANKPKKSGMPMSSLHWWKATYYSEVGDHRKAAECYDDVLKLAAKDNKESLNEIRYDYASELFEIGRYDEAKAFFNQVLADDGTDQDAMVGVAYVMVEQGDVDGAIALMDRCAALDRNYAGTYSILYMAYDAKGETDKAIDAYLEFYNQYDNATIAEGIEILLKHASYATAKIKAYRMDDGNALKWNVLLLSIHKERGDYEQVLKVCDDLEQDYGIDAFISLRRADALEELGMMDKAMAQLDKVLELDSDYAENVYAIRHDLYRDLAMYGEAMAEAEKVIDVDPLSAWGYYARGWCWELEGNDDRAMEDYNTGIDIDKSYPYIYLMRGKLYLKRGDEDAARRDFETVLQLDTLAENGSCREYALHFLGKDDEALEWMEKIIAREPYNAGHWYDKACLYSRMGRQEESVKALEKSLEMGYCSFAHIEHDDDMDLIRDRDDFKALMEKYGAIHREKLLPLGEDYAVPAETVTSEIPIQRHPGGTFEVPCSVNGLDLRMIFDTGASDVSISKIEADFMLKNNYLSKNDIKGKQYYQTADGGISEGTVITLKEVKIGEALLRNIEASVSKSQTAPLLLGQSVLEKFGTYTVDNINSKLIIKQ